MPLDSNLFTLLVQSRGHVEPRCVDIVIDTVGQDHAYTVVQLQNEKLELLDPYTEFQHCTLLQLSQKLKLVELQSPFLPVELKSTGSINFEWTFSFDNHKWCWRRDAIPGMGSERGYTLYAYRKPDPDYPVTIYRPHKKRPFIQMLDYNLARIEPSVEDKKGLEIMTIATLFSFIDFDVLPIVLSASNANTPLPTNLSEEPSNANHHLDPLSEAHILARTKSSPSYTAEASLKGKMKDDENRSSSVPGGPPSNSREGLIINEIRILSADPKSLDAYASQALKLLDDSSLLFVTLIARDDPKLVGMAVKLAEEIKRKRYKSSGEELMQYVLPLDNPEQGTSVPLNIKSCTYCVQVTLSMVKGLPLDEQISACIDTPPSSIKIYISRLALDELLPSYKPKASANTKTKKPDIRPPIMLGQSKDLIPKISAPPRPPLPSSHIRTAGPAKTSIHEDDGAKLKERESLSKPKPPEPSLPSQEEVASGTGSSGGGLFSRFF